MTRAQRTEQSTRSPQVERQLGISGESPARGSESVGSDACDSHDLDIFDAAPLCERCAASVCASGDTLCPECRSEVDVAFDELPGAGEGR